MSVYWRNPGPLSGPPSCPTEDDRGVVVLGGESAQLRLASNVCNAAGVTSGLQRPWSPRSSAESTERHRGEGRGAVPLSVLGLQAAIADGSEQTFDGQPMQAGTHLRWAFAPELGFPPGAFWLCRRSLRDPPCGPNAPPVAVSKAMAGQRAEGTDTSTGTDNAAATASATTNAPQGLGSVVSFRPGDSTPPDRCGRCCCCLALVVCPAIS